MKRLQFISVIIIMSIVLTSAVQAYWLWINFKENKRQLISEISSLLESSVDEYYQNLARKNVVNLWKKGDSTFNSIKVTRSRKSIDSLISSVDTLITSDSIENTIIILSNDSVNTGDLKNHRRLHQDSLMRTIRASSLEWMTDTVEKGNKFELLTSKVIISLQEDTFDIGKLNELFSDKLLKKQLDLNYRLISFNDTEFRSDDFANQNVIISRSSLLPGRNQVVLFYYDLSQKVFIRGIWGFVFSALVISTIVSALIFMNNEIKKQKQLSSIKNDLINNITHEFKTPIATVMTAIEAIQSFNELSDPEKTKKYLDLSDKQLKKLNAMVEKLLETATLDKGQIELKHTDENLVSTLENLVTRYRFIEKSKKIEFNSSFSELNYTADYFHLENAIENLIDNAVKYGGSEIIIDLNGDEKSINITIKDNGQSINEKELKRVFEQFYRVPTGNIHNVKGFGIGLYYSKKIIEELGGKISAERKNNWTHFTISLPI